MLAGQNLDQDPRMGELLIVLQVEPDAGPAMLMCTFAGLIGYVGVNSAGVAFFQNALSTRAWRREGMPHYLLKRVLLEQDSLAGCLAVLERARVCSSANYVLVDRTGLLDVELTPDGCRRIEPNDGLLVHGNHFLHPSLVPEDALLPALPDSPHRVARLRALIDTEGPLLELSALGVALADHIGYPASVCRHEPRLASIASVIAEPDAGRLHVAAGNPCQTAHVMYSLA
jgi:isopenicillin-N N-acyltransferase-like protein